MLVKVAALAAALLAANIFLFRAEVAHSVQVGSGVSRDYVTAEYGKLGRAVPDVLLAVMADIEEDAIPTEWVYPETLGVARAVKCEMACALFPDHVRAIVGDEKACGPAGQRDGTQLHHVTVDGLAEWIAWWDAQDVSA